LFSFGILLSVARGTLLFKPSLYQGTSAELCVCARSIKSVRNRLNAARINGNRPQVWLDADTNGVAHASVFHPLIVRRNPRPYNGICEAVFIRRTPAYNQPNPRPHQKTWRALLLSSLWSRHSQSRNFSIKTAQLYV
jgi:hypothetical protein